jgi:6,7-dimethyl-8-ribityllumazine synthase
VTSHEHEDLTIVERPRDRGAPPEPPPSDDAEAWPADRPASGEEPRAAGEPAAEEDASSGADADADDGDEPDAGSDPFAAWPQPQSGAVVEDLPEAEELVEHASGEIDVPDGYAVIEGTPHGRRRSVAVVVSRFNGGLTNRMLAVALDELDEAGVSQDAITVVPVPGAFELPLAAMALAKTRRYACVVALGAIVRGETPHFEYVASEAASGLQLAGIETGIPVSFGVLTVETAEQGEARIDRAAEAVRSALEMADVFAQLRASLRG